MLSSLQSMKVPWEPILITEYEGEFFFPRFARNDRRYTPLSRCLRQRHHSDQLPHPWGASDGPDSAMVNPYINENNNVYKLRTFPPIARMGTSYLCSWLHFLQTHCCIHTQSYQSHQHRWHSYGSCPCPIHTHQCLHVEMDISSGYIYACYTLFPQIVNPSQ